MRCLKVFQLYVSVIVVNYNCHATLRDCITSILLSRSVGELLLVDNASSDGSLDLVKGCTDARLKVIRLKRNVGLAKARNLAASKTKSPYIAFTDADSVVDPEWLQDPCYLLKTYKEIGAVQCKVLSLKHPDIIWNAGVGLNDLGYWSGMPKDSLTSYRYILFPIGAGFVIRHDAWDLVNGFDSVFFVGYDDIDLGIQLWLSGYQVVCSFKGIVYHDGGGLRSRKDIAPIFRYYAERNLIYLWAKNFQGKTLVKHFLPFSLLYPLMAFWRFGNVGLIGLVSLLNKVPLIIVKRYEVQQRRKISDEKIIQMLTRSKELPVQRFASDLRQFCNYILRRIFDRAEESN